MGRGKLICAEIHCPVVAYQDTVSRNAWAQIFFLSPLLYYATPAQRAVTTKHPFDPVPGLFMVVVWASPEQPVRIRKLSAYLDMFERTTLLLVRKSHGLEEHPVYYKPLVHLRVSSRNNVLSS